MACWRVENCGRGRALKARGATEEGLEEVTAEEGAVGQDVVDLGVCEGGGTRHGGGVEVKTDGTGKRKGKSGNQPT